MGGGTQWEGNRTLSILLWKTRITTEPFIGVKREISFQEKLMRGSGCVKCEVLEEGRGEMTGKQTWIYPVIFSRHSVVTTH